MEKLKELLIGAQLKTIDENGFTVIKDGGEYQFEYKTEPGDCCGYAEITDALLMSEEDYLKNPIITNIEIDYSGQKYGSETIKVVLYGDSKPMYEINAEAGSGSGCCYGACASVECKLLDYNETLASW